MLNEYYEKWNRFAPFGVLVIALGLLLTGSAFNAKGKKRRGFLKGIAGLFVSGFGLGLILEALKARSSYESELNKLKKD